MNGNGIRELKNTATDLRKHIIRMIYKAEPGSCCVALSS